jgi:hypothetical protein
MAQSLPLRGEGRGGSLRWGERDRERVTGMAYWSPLLARLAALKGPEVTGQTRCRTEVTRRTTSVVEREEGGRQHSGVVERKDGGRAGVVESVAVEHGGDSRVGFENGCKCDGDSRGK